MWRKVSKSEEQSYIDKAINFTGNHSLYGSYMMEVLNQYPISCEQFLSNININRRAWIGHAACNIAINCPEYLTRQAWKYLTDEQRRLANNQADKAIIKWELLNNNQGQLCLEMQY
jgi:hypothetical protein